MYYIIYDNQEIITRFDNLETARRYIAKLNGDRQGLIELELYKIAMVIS